MAFFIGTTTYLYMAGLQLQSPPAIEPVTLAEAKAHMRVTSSTDDTYITALISAVRQQVEAWLGRALITQQWLYTFDLFPTSPWNLFFGTTGQSYNPVIQIPLPPCQSVDSITYLDLADGSRLPYTTWTLDNTCEPARVVPNWMTFFPISRPMIGNVQVTFTAGYGDDEADVPLSIRQAILELIATHYENRESVTNVAMKEIPHHVEFLLAANDFGLYMM